MADLEKPVSASRRSIKPLLAVFWTTTAVFVLLITFILTQNLIENSKSIFEYIFFPGIALLTVLGIVLIVMAARAPIKKGLKWAMVLTGVSAVGMPVGAILHNVVYGLMVYFSRGNPEGGAGGGDEAFFFILSLMVFPVVLIICAIMGAVILAKAKGDVWV